MQNAERRMSKTAIATALLMGALGASAFARAADLDVQVSSRETQVGVPIVLQVAIQNGRDNGSPVLPQIPNVKVRSRGGPSRSSQTTIINGTMKSSVSLTYQYELTPQKEGRFTIPPITLKSDGQTLKSQPITVVVSKSETGDLLFVEIKGDRKRLYVGESLGVKLQIWLRPFTDRNYGKLDASSMWSCIDLRGSDWGSFAEPLQNILNQQGQWRGREVLRKDSQGQERSYYLYEVERTLQVDRPGQLSPEDINVLVTYPTRLGRSNDFFSMGRLAILSHMQISAQAQVEPIEVLPVPTKGRPADYTGAVGQYKIEASAKPTTVAVGDPITLTLSISGTSNLQQLPAPAVNKCSELNASFRVPSDPLAGEVVGEAKQFAVSIRAKSDSVKEIPAIPFTYFDPAQEKFVTVKSEPIPLKVSPASKLALSQIVDATGQRAPVANRLTESTGGILANYTDMDEVLSQQAFEPGVVTWLLLALPPISFVVSWTVQRRSERLRTDVGFARKRRARRDAISKLRHAEAASTGEAAAAAASAIGQYVADRCNVPTGGMTRSAVLEQLRTRGASADIVDQVDGLLEECESIHYAGTGTRSAAELLSAAVSCIDRLERERI